MAQAFSPMIDGIDPGNNGVSAERITAAAAVGGTASALSGGKFANGALAAAFSRLFNGELHARFIGIMAHDAIERDLQRRLPQYDVEVERRIFGGRIDATVYDPLTGITDVFEIKPASHDDEGWRNARARAQLARYVDRLRQDDPQNKFRTGEWSRFFRQASFVTPAPGVPVPWAGKFYTGQYHYGGEGKGGIIFYSVASFEHDD
jgi:hypothetical protein